MPTYNHLEMLGHIGTDTGYRTSKSSGEGKDPEPFFTLGKETAFLLTNRLVGR